jgi:hypothetical protein
LTYGTARPAIVDRRELGLVLNRRRLLGCGVEVGVKQGAFSDRLLQTWKGRHLISVDPWASAPDDEYVDVANVAQDEHERYYAETLQRLSGYGQRSSVWRMTGEQAAMRVPHHSLDFVYLDARHDQASVSEDLRLWFDKVRPGGMIAGHDYLDGHRPNGIYGVRTAVDEFFGGLGLRVAVTSDPPWPSWYVLVPAVENGDTSEHETVGA